MVVKNNGPDASKNVVANLSNLKSLNLEILNISSNSFNKTNYKWNIGSLDKGKNISLVLTTIVNTSNKTINVKSIVGSDTFELNKANNYDNDSLKVNPLCDLVLDINVSDSPVNKEDIVDWTIVVRNDGPDNANNVYVDLSDLESLNLEILNVSDDSFDKDSNKWFIGSLYKNNAIDLIIATKVNASNKTIVVDAIVDSDTFELNKANNYDNETLNINPLCDLVVALDLSNSTINKEDIVNWTISVRNDGPDASSNVILDLSDLEDLGLIILNVSDDSFDDESNKWFIGDLAPGETVDLIVTSQANISNVSLPVEAMVDSDTFELNKANNYDNETLNINPLCDLIIEITVSNHSVNKGDVVEWTIVVYNNGPDDAEDVMVSLDDLKALSLILLNVTYGSIQNDISYDGSKLFEKNSSSSFDDSSLYSLADNNLDENDGNMDNSVTNQLLSASSILSGVGSDGDYSAKLLSNSNSLSSSNSLRLSSYLSDENPSDDSSLSNSLDSDLSENNDFLNSDLSDDLSQNSDFINFDSSNLSTNLDQSSPNTFNNETNEWYVGDLAKDKNIVLKLSTEVNKSNDNITVPANVNTSTYEIEKSNNHDEDQLEVLPICDLEITIVPDKDSIYKDDTVNWIITLTNNGPNDAKDVNGFIDIPNALKFLAYDLDKGSLENISDASNLRLKWDVGDLATDETIMLFLSTKALKDGVYLNNVSVNSSTFDSNESNNYDDALVEVLPLEDDPIGNETLNKSKVIKKLDKKENDIHHLAKKQNVIPMKRTGNSFVIVVLIIFALFSLNYRKIKF